MSPGMIELIDFLNLQILWSLIPNAQPNGQSYRESLKLKVQELLDKSSNMVDKLECLL